MRWVDQARLYPGRCAVLPQAGAAHPLGYVDTGQTTISGERVYVSVLAVQTMAEGLGYVRPGDETGLKAEVARLRAELDEATGRLSLQDEELAAVHVLKRGGFAASKKPGRPQAKVA